ncbi:hypothetical protein SERLA73DRAFT_173621 [Serpula lacrymans var. lacrymans S7.3]|uniref:Carbohydrate-binding module family 50 protein n=2 Tax=Serpula lacrymans var. lacrymans TaxID=341189 RepID=F8PEX4_SERL3|nr:uncharacterized protein SERLADRAFT_454412 [Serpula lacrymans var. lacrymans S7.9]EGO04185.1 hypothetical protein SERLA73DRAFT_173621 [Serpula lacrymans var. lacrymans S7.3]EGO30129.1 hypothetical protein SERLADRAFT_454412 [Serpula lacrymans var. lacrymans S7.9]
MSNRWTQYTEDSCRLPEGVTRIAYDADSGRYTFRDRSGQLYESAPHAEYGELTPVSSPSSHRRRVTITERRDPRLYAKFTNGPPKTFNDILPSDYIASPLEADADGSSDGSKSPSPVDAKDAVKGRFINAVRQSTVPKMHNAVDGVMKRSKSMVDRRRTRSATEDKRLLLSSDGESIRSVHELDDQEIFARIISQYGPPPSYPSRVSKTA